MMVNLVFLIHIIILFCIVKTEETRKFPDDFSFGVGTSAYQIEGSWNIDGKSENIWDHWIHTDPTRIANNDTADVACDSYKYFVYDGFYANRIGVQHYRFSIPWTRILPSGFADVVNAKSIMRYQELLLVLELFNITPVAVLYYHDLPQSLQDIGGWTNPDMAKYFADYARICFQYFPEVKYWITFNDPRATCRKGYGEGTFAPGITSDGVGEYSCAYTVLKAHAAAYHVYKEEFQNLTGKMSIALDLKWSEPASETDTEAVERRNAFEFGLYANPIYKGNWPEEVIDRVAYRSTNENFTKSRLPEFTQEEIDYINGTSDFMAINLYDVNIVADTEEPQFGDPSYMKDLKVKLSLDPSWEIAVNGQPVVPSSARKALVWLSDAYDSPDIFITENGVPDVAEQWDNFRINYLRNYLNATLDAIIEDGINVIGYTVRSLYDSFEWTDGYSYKFGLHYIDFDSEEKLVREKESMQFYSQVAKYFTIPEEEPTTTEPSTTTPGSATKASLYPVLILFNVILFRLVL